jgi:hypothetical protein
MIRVQRWSKTPDYNHASQRPFASYSQHHGLKDDQQQREFHRFPGAFE